MNIREREHIARQLREVVLVRLSELGFELASAKSVNGSSLSDQDRVQMDQRIQSAIEDVDSLIRELRKLARGIVSGPDLHRGGDSALLSLLDGVATRMNGEVISIEGPAGLVAPPAARHVHAAARDALRNTVVHAQTSKVSLGLLVRADAVELRVTDDAVGAPLQQDQGGWVWESWPHARGNGAG